MVDYIPLMALLASGMGVGLIAWLSYKSGKETILKEHAEMELKVSNEQKQVIVNRPDKSDLLDSMRDGTF